MLILFFFSLAVYLKCLFPTFALGDGGNFATAAVTLGVVHPPGYPLFALLGKVIQLLLPLGSPAWRLNFLTALFTASAVSITVLSLRQLGINKSWSLVAGLVLALAKGIIGNSLAGEVYSLNLFFLSLIFYLAARRRWALLFLFYGLSLANHYIMFLYAPAFLLYWIIAEKPSFKKIFFYLGLALLGWSIYLYLPLRAFNQPKLNWGKTSNWFYFSQHLRRSQFKMLEFSARVGLGEKIRFTLYFLAETLRQFKWGLGILALLGLTYGVTSRKRKEFYLLLWIWLLTGPGLIWALNFHFGAVNRYRFDPYLLPCWWSLTIGLAWALSRFFQRYNKHRFSKLVLALTCCALVSVPVFTSIPNTFSRQSYFAYDLGRNVLRSLPACSILFTSGSNNAFALYYLTVVENRRPDVNIYDRGGVVFTGLLDAPLFKITAAEWEEGFQSQSNALISRGERPVYYVETPPASAAVLWKAIPRGIVYEAALTENNRPLPSLILRDKNLLTDDFWLNYERATLYLKMAEFYHYQAKGQVSSDYLAAAQSVSKEIDSLQEAVGLTALKGGLPDLAVQAYTQAVKINPWSDQAHARLAYALLQSSRYEESLAETEIALKNNPLNPLAQQTKKLLAGKNF